MKRRRTYKEYAKYKISDPKRVRLFFPPHIRQALKNGARMRKGVIDTNARVLSIGYYFTDHSEYRGALLRPNIGYPGADIRKVRKAYGFNADKTISQTYNLTPRSNSRPNRSLDRKYRYERANLAKNSRFINNQCVLKPDKKVASFCSNPEEVRKRNLACLSHLGSKACRMIVRHQLKKEGKPRKAERVLAAPGCSLLANASLGVNPDSDMVVGLVDEVGDILSDSDNGLVSGFGTLLEVTSTLATLAQTQSCFDVVKNLCSTSVDNSEFYGSSTFRVGFPIILNLIEVIYSAGSSRESERNPHVRAGLTSPVEIA